MMLLKGPTYIPNLYQEKYLQEETLSDYEPRIETPRQREQRKRTGERKNIKKLRWRNFPLFLFKPVVAVGAAAEKHKDNPNGKYDTYNFLKGLPVADTMDSLKRHLVDLDDPSRSDYDTETKQHHLAHIAWNALVALHNIETRSDLDDRYRPNKETEET